MSVAADVALSWLIEGNNDYIIAEKNHHGDISPKRRVHTHKHGQNPFAVIITCSDSRVIPENIFSILVTLLLDLPILFASTSWVYPNFSINC